MPVEPKPSRWVFPPHEEWDPGDDLVAVGADLDAGTLLRAYRCGLFPMPTNFPGEPMGWFSPTDRGVLPLDGMRVSRSLRRSAREFEVRLDTSFEAVMRECGRPERPDGWITDDFLAAYCELHELGWAHSVEVWRDGELAGGLYGVAIGGLFAGESMFHRVRDASKVALLALVDLLNDEHGEHRVLDVQWQTAHLATLGVVELDREDYLERLHQALACPLPAPWT